MKSAQNEIVHPVCARLTTLIFCLTVSVLFLWQGATQAASSVPAFSSVQYALALVASSRGFGTAFCVFSDDHKSFFLTNRHVVGIDKTVKVVIQGTVNQLLTARVVRVGTGALDAAVLVVDYPNLLHLYLSSVLPDPGTAIGVAGYPKSQLKLALMRLGLSPSVHAGTVSANVGKGYYLEFDAQSEPGNSGGPLFDSETGLVYGLITYKLGDRETNLAIATPELVAFLQNAGISSAFNSELAANSPGPSATSLPTPIVMEHDTYVPYVDGWDAKFPCDNGGSLEITMHSFPVAGWPNAMRVTYHFVMQNSTSSDSDTLEADDAMGNATMLGVFTAGALVPNTPFISVPLYPEPAFSVTNPDGTVRKFLYQMDWGAYKSVHIFRDTGRNGKPIDDTVFGLNIGLLGIFFPSLDANPHVSCILNQTE